MTANRQAFLTDEVLKREYKTINVPVIGEVVIQTLSEKDRSEFESKRLDDEGNWDPTKAPLTKPHLILAVVVDDEGNRLFSDSDVETIQRMDSRITNAIWSEAIGFCGFRPDEVDELEKN